MPSVIDWTLTADDVFEFEMSIELADSTELFQLEGVTTGATGNLPVFSRIGISGGKTADTVPRKAPDSQTQLNQWAGMVWALRENIFIDENGIKYRVSDLTLRLPGQYLVADFDTNYHRFDYQGLRVDFSLFLFWLKSFNFEIDPATGESGITLVFAPATAAPAGVTYVPPQEGTAPGGGDPNPFPFPPVLPSNGFPLGTGRLIVMDTSGQLFYTATANSETPVWAEATLSLADVSNDFIADPFCPLYLNSSGDLWLRVTTTTRIYLLEIDTSDFSITATSQKTLSSAGWSVRRIEMERGTPNFAIVISQYASSVTTCATTDGSSWGSEVTVSSGATSYSVPGVYPSPRTPGKVITSQNLAAGAFAGRLSTDYGATYGSLTNPLLSEADGQGWIGGHIPFHNNNSESIAYGGWQAAAESASWHQFHKYNGTAGATDISPTYSGSKAGAQFPRGIDTAPNNRLKLAAILRNGSSNAGAASDIVRVAYCLDGGAGASSWQYISALDFTVGSGNFFGFVRVLGDGSGFYAGGVAQLFACDFAGNSRDVSGNLAALGATRLLNVVGW